MKGIFPGRKGIGYYTSKEIPRAFVGMEEDKAECNLGRPAKPEDQGAMIPYLASQMAKHITGQPFFVDTGHKTMV
jgi:enoyl-[acyl-carrier-protein] reductase (NADH)